MIWRVWLIASPRRRHDAVFAVFESGNDVLNAGSDASVGLPVLVADGAAGVIAPGCDDGGDAPVGPSPRMTFCR